MSYQQEIVGGYFLLAHPVDVHVVERRHSFVIVIINLLAFLILLINCFVFLCHVIVPMCVCRIYIKSYLLTLSGYRVEQFAQLYAKKVGVSATVLQQTLWGDFCLDSKTKMVKKGAQVSLTYC